MKYSLRSLTLLFTVAVLSSFVLGAALYKFRVFPFGKGYAVSLGLVQPSPQAPVPMTESPNVSTATLGEVIVQDTTPKFEYSTDKKCNSLPYDRQALNNVAQSLVEIKHNQNFLYGDSIIADARDLRTYNVNYIGIGISGLIIYCSLVDIDVLLQARPNKVILYLGGNDADGQSFYDPFVAGWLYELKVRRLIEAGVRVVVHGVHRGHKLRRNQEFVDVLNQKLIEISHKLQVKYLPPMDKFDFNGHEISTIYQKTNVYNEYTYDGEHLKGLAYRVWFKEIGRRVSGFQN